MNFLNKGVFSNDQVLLGAVLTEFDANEICFRPRTHFYTAKELRSKYDSLGCRGFHFDDGVLYSDSSSFCCVTEDVARYLDRAFKQSDEVITDITDLVLYGLANSFSILPKYDEGNRDIILPFSKLKVSSSTFNIYAPYYLEDLGFRTCSLLNTEDLESSEFVMAAPTEVDCSRFSSMLNLLEAGVDVNGSISDIYRVHPVLAENRVFMGEAFTNYCAFMSAHYHIGEKVIKTLYKTYGNDTPYPKDMVTRSPRRRKLGANISIEHDYYKEFYLNDVLERIKDVDALSDFVRQHPAASSCYTWIASVMKTAHNFVKDGKDMNDAILSACPVLFSECVEEELKYNIELLSTRYTVHIMDSTIGGIQLPMIMKGGGVNGTTFLQRASW